MTGGQVIARALKEYGVTYVAGIPGHGAWSMIDALLQPGSDIPFLQVMHEQCAVHLADGFYRATGKPMAAYTSVGPGATNTVIGLATAYTDSTAVFLATGAPSTHMRGHGVMQEIERVHSDNFARITEVVTKRQWSASRVDELPSIMHRAFNAMMTGRRGPVHVEVPMDVQTEAADVQIHPLAERMAIGSIRADSRAIEAAAALLLGAKRPVIVAGGGAISSDASVELTRLAERLGVPVVTTWNGKGAISEDHALNAWSVGQTGTPCGNHLAATADVVLSVGCRFTDWSASSWKQGASFAIPPGKLIHIDVDFQEIGKNYPTAVGIVADARSALADLSDAISEQESRKTVSQRTMYHAEVGAAKRDWEAQLATRRDGRGFPFTSQRPLAALRSVMDRDGIVVVGSGNTQGAVKQTFPVYGPRTHITSGSFSPMGWAYPASLGVKLARPHAQVACVLGDGDFLMSMQEMATSVMHQLPVVVLLQNNSGYMSIRGGQRKITGRHVGSEFNTRDGHPYSPDFVATAKSFGMEAWRVDSEEALESTIRRAFDCGAPALVEVPTARDAAGPFVPGWWDFPIPEYVVDDEGKRDYETGRNLEQHL